MELGSRHEIRQGWLTVGLCRISDVDPTYELRACLLPLSRKRERGPPLPALRIDTPARPAASLHRCASLCALSARVGACAGAGWNGRVGRPGIKANRGAGGAGAVPAGRRSIRLRTTPDDLATALSTP